MRRSWLIWLVIWLIMTAGLITWANLSVASAKTDASQIPPAEFRRMLEKAFEEHPEIVIDILRDHSEVVLDIAQQGANNRRRNVLIAQWEKDAKVPKKPLLTNRPMRGDKDAPVTIVSFSDFTCSYCTQAAAIVQSLMLKHAGQVRYVFKHYPLGSQGTALLAAQYHVAASLQDKKKAWIYYDRIFANSGKLLSEGEDFLKATAKALKFDMKKLVRDVKGRTVQAILNEDRLDAEKLGVQGTPFFLVNNLIIRGALPIDLFSEAIEQARRFSP